jgi:DNA-directed RNA polymerase subunit beta'
LSSAIQLHPCVCAGYNADFDDDKWLSIFLSKRAQEEAIELMLPSHNLLKPADGSPITLPNKEMALGIFYLTSIDDTLKKDPMPTFANQEEALLAFSLERIALKEPVNVRIADEVLETSIGRIMFNERLPQEFEFINEAIKASGIKRLITRAIRTISPDRVALLIDSVKTHFYAATILVFLFRYLIMKWWMGKMP